MGDFLTFQEVIAGVEWSYAPRPVAYLDAVSLMEENVAGIILGKRPEGVWLLEHEDVYTIGTSGNSCAFLKPTTVPVHSTGRGGQVTYHGPGQRIGYVMLDLKKRKIDPKAYVQRLQAWVQAALLTLGVQTQLRPDRIGLWVTSTPSGTIQESKLVAMGIRIRKGVCFHGFAVNLSPDLGFFESIVPCGMHDYGVTSLQRLGKQVSFTQLDTALKACFNQFFPCPG